MVAANRTLPIMAGETIRAAQRDVSHGVFGVQPSVTELKWLRVGTPTKHESPVKAKQDHQACPLLAGCNVVPTPLALRVSRWAVGRTKDQQSAANGGSECCRYLDSLWPKWPQSVSVCLQAVFTLSKPATVSISKGLPGQQISPDVT